MWIGASRVRRPAYLFCSTNPAHHRQFGLEYGALDERRARA